MPPLLDVRDLHTEFRTGAGVVPAVDGISYTVDRGETVAIVGESGSGENRRRPVDPPTDPGPAGRVTRGEIIFFPAATCWDCRRRSYIARYAAAISA